MTRTESYVLADAMRTQSRPVEALRLPLEDWAWPAHLSRNAPPVPRSPAARPFTRTTN